MVEYSVGRSVILLSHSPIECPDSRRTVPRATVHIPTADASATLVPDARVIPRATMSLNARCFVDDVQDDFLCAICRLVLRHPVRFACDAHAFCHACALAWCERQGARRASCPMCRARASDRAEQTHACARTRRAMERVTMTCGCGVEVNLWRDAAGHYARCALAPTEVGGGTRDANERRSWNASWASSERARDGNDERGGARWRGGRRRGGGDDDDDDDDDDDPLYLCPHCEEEYASAEGRDADDDDSSSDLPDALYFRGMRAFSEHVMFAHRDEAYPRPAVCPMCSALPSGDPTMMVNDLFDHVTRRHAFDWTLYMPNLHTADEYEVVAEILRISREEAEAAGE